MSTEVGPNRLVPSGHCSTKHLILYAPGEEKSMAQAVREAPSSPTEIILTGF